MNFNDLDLEKLLCFLIIISLFTRCTLRDIKEYNEPYEAHKLSPEETKYE